MRRLATEDVVVIAAGGGGIPVVRENGRLKGVDAVIDKDLASSCLASTLEADLLVMLTDVPCVALWFGTAQHQDLRQISISQARRWLKEGQFPEGSMGPKVEAAVEFVEHSGNDAIITTPERLQAALEGGDGTRILP